MRIRVHANICEWDKVIWLPTLCVRGVRTAFQKKKKHPRKGRNSQTAPKIRRAKCAHYVLCSVVGREMDTDDLLLLYTVKSLFYQTGNVFGFFWFFTLMMSLSALSSTTLHVWRTKSHALLIQMDFYRLPGLYCPSNCPESDPNNTVLHRHAIIVPLWSPSTRVRTIMALTD